MAFLGGLFKRKPGGTLIGNLLRGVSSQVTGGLLGSGAGMISQLDADKRDLTDPQFLAKYGYDKNGVYPATPVQATQQVVQTTTPYITTTQNQMELSTTGIKAWAKTQTGKIVIGLTIVGLVFLAWKKWGKGGKRKGGIF